MITWKGTPIEELSREELIEALTYSILREKEKQEKRQRRSEFLMGLHGNGLNF